MKIELLRYDSKDGTFTPDEAEKILSEEGVAYLKKHEPIGCRDKGTQCLLENRGIKVFFTGCVTMTLGGTYQHKSTRKSVIFVQNKKLDHSPSRLEGLLKHVNCIQYRTGHWLGLNGFETPELIDIDYVFTNKNTHFDLANEMSERCINFIYEN